MASAIQLLLADHRNLKKLAKKVSTTKENAGKLRKDLFTIIKFEATLHEKVEEKFLYPLLKKYKMSRANALEHYEEVAVMKHLITKLSKGGYETEEWTAKFEVFKELTEHHIEEEEEEFFPKAVKLISAIDLKTIGEQIEKFKERYHQR